MSANTIVHKVTRRYLLQNRKRTLFSLISITLMVILMTGVFIGKDTVIASFIHIAEAEKGKWHINVYDVDQDQCEEIISQPYVQDYGISEHPGVSVFKESPDQTRPYLDLREYSLNSMDWMNLQITEGRKPEKEGEIMLSEALRRDGSSIQTGDEIHFVCNKLFIRNNSEFTKFFPFQQIIIEPWQSVEVQADFPYFNDPEIEEILEPSGYEKTYTVTGFMEAPFFESASGAGYTAVAYHDNVVHKGSFNLSLRVNDESEGMYQFLREITGGNYDVNNYVMIFTGQSTSYTLNLIVILAEVFLCGVIMLVSVVLMNNVFALSYDERLKYLGMLSSIGATGKQKRSSVYYEAFFLLAFALPLGFVLGLVMVKGVVSLMKPAAAAFMGIHITKDVPVRIVLKYSSVLLVIASSVLTVLASAVLPARKIAKAGAVSALRASGGTKTKIQKTSSWKNRSAEALLAKGFLKKENRRSGALVKAVCAFISVMITVGYASGALIQMASVKLSDGQQPGLNFFKNYEYLLLSERDGEMFENTVMALEQSGGIEKAVTVYDMSSCGVSDASVYSDEYMNAYKDVIYQYYPEGLSEEQYLQEHVKDTDFFADLLAVDDELFAKIAAKTGAVIDDTDLPVIILIKDGYLSTDTYSIFGRDAENYRYHEIADKYSLKPGDTFFLNLGGGNTEFYVGAKASAKQLADWFEYSSYKLGGFISVSQADRLMAAGILRDDTRSFVFDADETNTKLNDMLDTLRRMPMHNTMFASHDDYLPETIQTSLKALIRILLISFAVLTAAICFLNIFNSVNGMISYRRRTFAVLKAMGTTDGQLHKTMRLEMAQICLRSIIAAGLISLVLCYGIHRIFTGLFGNFTVPLPYGAILSAIAASLVMVSVSEWYTYKKEVHGNLIEEIRRDSI